MTLQDLLGFYDHDARMGQVVDALASPAAAAALRAAAAAVAERVWDGTV